jgi:hypothetical protein
MLGQLDEPQRVQVSRLLAELSELGIPREPIPIPVAVPAPMSPGLREALHGESPDFVAALLAAEPWPWKAAYLASLPRARRAAISSRLGARESHPVAPRLQMSLMEIGVRPPFPRSDSVIGNGGLSPISWIKKLWTKR